MLVFYHTEHMLSVRVANGEAESVNILTGTGGYTPPPPTLVRDANFLECSITTPRVGSRAQFFWIDDRHRHVVRAGSRSWAHRSRAQASIILRLRRSRALAAISRAAPLARLARHRLTRFAGSDHLARPGCSASSDTYRNGGARCCEPEDCLSHSPAFGLALVASLLVDGGFNWCPSQTLPRNPLPGEGGRPGHVLLLLETALPTGFWLWCETTRAAR